MTSKIEWTDETWNPVTGCTKVSQGCKNCYAERQWPRMVRLIPSYAGREFTDVRTHADRLDKPLRWQKPRRIFVNSMSDLFHEDVPDEFIDQVFAVMALAPQHTFQVLTKRAHRMREYLSDSMRLEKIYIQWNSVSGLPREAQGWPLPNVWMGVSIEDQPTADARIVELLETPASVRWISAEPLLGPVNVGLYLSRTNMPGLRMMPGFVDPLPGIDWVVVGGESGPKARPTHPQWARVLRDQCAVAGVPFLFKQWGEWSPSSVLPKDILLAYERWCWISENGGEPDTMHHAPFKDEFAHHELMGRVGKRVSGRILDDVQHDGYPEFAK